LAAFQDGALDKNKFGRLGSSAVLGSLTAMLVAAPLALPLIQYTTLSTRRFLSAGDQELFALPLVRMFGLALPLSDVPEYVIYIGLVLLTLLLAGVVLRSRPARRWGMSAVFFMMLSLGSATPLYSLLAVLPGFDLLRVPARYVALAAIAVALGGAHALDMLVGQVHPANLVKRLNLISVGLVSVFLALATLFFRGQDDGLAASIEVGLSGLGALILILAGKRLGKFRRLYPALWLTLVFLDLMWMNTRILEVRPAAWENNPAWMEEIEPAGWGQRRVFSPSYSLGQDRAALHQIEMVGGVHPLQLSAYYAYVAEAAGFDPDQYSVTVPPFPAGDPSIPWAVNLDSRRLGKLNVEYILSDYPLSNPDLNLISDQDMYVYVNLPYRPRAWVEPEADSQRWASVEQISWSPNRIVVQATGPGQLVLSEVDYPGWSVTSNGELIDSILYDGLLRSVQLAEGQQQVEWVYRPILTWVGLGSWGVLILSLAVIRLKWWT
jgi:hypothetical protein